MGVNLGHLAQSLGIGGQPQPQLQQPNAQPGFTMSGQQPAVGMHPLLGATQATGELPAVGSAPGVGQNDGGEAQPAPQEQQPAEAPPVDIEVQGQVPPRMSADSLGMPGMTAARAASAEATGDLRQQLRDKADMARDIYHKGSEFGTHGILRDVIGNVADLGRHLLGFSPRYNDEKWSERAYGMSSTDPNVAAAATEQAMQYNPTKTMAYRHQLVGDQNTIASTGATTEYKNAQAASRYTQQLSGFGASLFQANANADPATAQANYARTLPAIQATLDKAYGPGVMQAPEQYTPEFARQLAQMGFTGSNVQRAQANTLDNDTRREVAQGRNLTSVEVAHIGADARRYQADASYKAAVNRAVVAGGDVTTVESETPTGSIVKPGKQTTRVVTHGPSSGGGAPSGAADRKFSGGHWYHRGPNGEAIRED